MIRMNLNLMNISLMITTTITWIMFMILYKTLRFNSLLSRKNLFNSLFTKKSRIPQLSVQSSRLNRFTKKSGILQLNERSSRLNRLTNNQHPISQSQSQRSVLKRQSSRQNWLKKRLSRIRQLTTLLTRS